MRSWHRSRLVVDVEGLQRRCKACRSLRPGRQGGPGRTRAMGQSGAQSGLVKLAKTLADNGEIMLVDPKSDDGMIY